MYKEMRVQFKKTGEAVYFSHLDLQRAMQRALRRSGIPFWSTGGFSPHPYCVFAQPLSLGFESEGELFDFRLREGEAFDPEMLKRAFPESLKVVDIYEPMEPYKKIIDATYKIHLRTKADAAAIRKVFDAPLMVLKKTKRSESEVDIRDFIKRIEAENMEDGVVLTCDVATGNEKTLNPNYIAMALERAGISCFAEKIIRICFLKENGEVFR